jgi:hypothetical protein
VFGIVERREGDAGGISHARDFYIVITLGDGFALIVGRMFEVAQSDNRARCVALHAGSDEADNVSVPPDRLIFIEQRLRIVQDKLNQTFVNAHRPVTGLPRS